MPYKVLCSCGAMVHDGIDVVPPKIGFRVCARCAATTKHEMQIIDNLVGQTAFSCGVPSSEVRAAVWFLTSQGLSVVEASTNVRNILMQLSTDGKIDEGHSLSAALRDLKNELQSIAGVTARLDMMLKRFGVENVQAASLLAFNIDAVARYIPE